MFKKLEELLEANSISKEVAEALDSEFSTALKTVRDEAAANRVKLKEAEDAYKAKLEEQKEDLEAKVAEAKQSGESEAEAKYAEKLKAVEAEKNEYSDKMKSATVEASVNRILADNKVDDAELARLYIEKHIVVDGSDTFIEMGGERLSLENGAKKLFEAKPSLISSSGSGGSGAGGGGGGVKTVSKSDFLAMTPPEQAALRADNPNIMSQLT